MSVSLVLRFTLALRIAAPKSHVNLRAFYQGFAGFATAQRRKAAVLVALLANGPPDT
jgi:hypothetical protein